MAKSKEKTTLLSRIEPARPREKTIPYPIETKGDRPTVTVRVLGNHERTRCYTETLEYFKREKSPLKADDLAFIIREKAAIVARAYTDEDGDPIGTVDEVHALPDAELELLYAEQRSLQADVAPVSYTEEELLRLVEEVKKNPRPEALVGLPSTLLSELVRTLAAQLSSSTPAKSSG